MNCIFCKIIKGEIPSTPIYTDEQVIAINDLHPAAPLHKLIIPKKHIATLNDLAAEDETLVGHMMYTAKTLAKELNIAEQGYRTVMNCNSDGGQTVFHIHLHLLGGKQFGWPPG